MGDLGEEQKPAILKATPVKVQGDILTGTPNFLKVQNFFILTNKESNSRPVSMESYTQEIIKVLVLKKIPHTGDTQSLDQCGQ